MSPTLGLELRVGFELSEREYGASGIPHTVFTEGAVAFGSDPVLPGHFRRFAVRANETLHYRSGIHRIKFGGTATIASFNNAYVPDTRGQFVFSGMDEFATLDGVFTQSVGDLRSVRYTSPEVGLFIQDIMTAAPGLELTMGMRADFEFVPWRDLNHHEAWFQTTGLLRADTSGFILKLSPRFGFNWDVGERGIWNVSGAVGVYNGSIGPTSLAELFSNDGSLSTRSGLGVMSSWPTAPDSTSAPVVGPTLTLLGPDFVPPRSTRATFSISTMLGELGTFHISTAYRHTDFLPRRHDINRLPSPISADQHGRPVYGELVQNGGTIAATPGSNRRFNEYDIVSALDADGFSDYLGFTAGFERRLGNVLNLFASYTYSRTDDNWLSGVGGNFGFQLSPFPGGLNGGDWADGRSDFDQPNRLTFGAEMDFGALRLAGFFRTESGVPFTPGFRPGVDANGDGSGTNDPAFVDGDIAGVTDLFSSWECLRGQAGSFAERNSCRGPTIKNLDLRLVLKPLSLGSYPFELIVDGLNLLDADIVELDRALYLVDPASSLVVDGVTGEVTLPLVVNPDFGSPVVRRGIGRVVRIGVRINHD